MKKDKGTETAIAQEGYEAKVGKELIQRGGQNKKGAKGIAHEIMYRDKLNVDPKNIITGKKTKLTKSTTAVRDDLVTMKDGKVVTRHQLKDTEKSIYKTAKQGSELKYRGTNLLGTKETTKAYAKVSAHRKAAGKVVPQKMTSTGISSADTERVAKKAFGEKVAPKGILSGAKAAGKAGGIISAAISVADDLLDEEPHDFGELALNAAKSGTSGYTSASAGFIGSEVAQAAIADTGIASTAIGGVASAAASVAGAVAAAAVASAVTTPIIEGVADAVEFGDPSYIADGVKESGETVLHGLDEAGGAALAAAGGVVDLACSALDVVHDAVSSSGPLDDFFDGIADFFDWF